MSGYLHGQDARHFQGIMLPGIMKILIGLYKSRDDDDEDDEEEEDDDDDDDGDDATGCQDLPLKLQI
jgi:hypothetical protein